MTEVPKPIDAALDLFVYAPVGLALTAAEELPKMAAKGRTRITNQITVARMVGQFAVTRGRQEIEKRFSAPAPAAAPQPVVNTNGSGPSTNGSHPDLPGTDVVEDTPVVHISTAGDLPDPTPSVPAAPPSGPSPEASELAIPGYDSLSASQVVQRLAGLRQDELTAVAAYEAAHRGRRTILNRIEQLRD